MAPKTEEKKSKTAQEAKNKKTVEKKKPAVAKKSTAAKKKKPVEPKKVKTAEPKKAKTVESKKVKPAKVAVVKKVAKSGAAPKKPLSGFMKFRQEHFEKVKGENPSDSAGQIGKRLGDMWRALSKEEMAAYKPAKTAAVKKLAPAVVATAPAILAA
ncbi:unnamed protein product [Cylindrotheca closterium]|uniref:HMG box domain-containing protein n=1 Tax=Cylindrotheca closterium TaxID=2856 RepID=A0AAD2CEF2_9STRA|nr:unnamed protein product [Cylindrotheca closterium]